MAYFLQTTKLQETHLTGENLVRFSVWWISQATIREMVGVTHTTVGLELSSRQAHQNQHFCGAQWGTLVIPKPLIQRGPQVILWALWPFEVFFI